MRFDLLMFVIALRLVLAMALTLLFGRDYSRHGYGSTLPRQEKTIATQTIIAKVFAFDFRRHSPLATAKVDLAGQEAPVEPRNKYRRTSCKSQDSLAWPGN